MVNYAAFMRTHWVNVFLPIGVFLGMYLDSLQEQKLTGFRNKSALYSRELKPGEETTWK
ncbi:NADH dehydrogenase [ubiquinone] 1 beta subcomplex subunit 1-like [Labrus bergylta]|uniref:NADH dehydrogenase [ubiquinone] 1 beta subcomplex subunit 1 n=1 Tax=Labrus bergylta TaxID=56723 RepID=A0A3Q3F7K0_9LABR